MITIIKNLPRGDFFYFIHFQRVATIAKIKYFFHLDTVKQLLYLQPISPKSRIGEILKRPTRADCKSDV